MPTIKEFKARLGRLAGADYLLRYLIPPKPGYSILAGDAGKGKTNLAFNLAAGIASGRSPIHGLDVKQGSVNYLLFEGGANLTDRLDKLEALYGADVLEANMGLDLWPSESIFQIKSKMISYFEGSQLGIIDPLNRIFPGDIRDSKTMAAFVRCIEEISTATGAHLLIVHHTRKKYNSPDARGIPEELDDIKGANEFKSGSLTIMMLRDEYQADLASWGMWKGKGKAPATRGKDYSVLAFKRAQAHPEGEPEPMGLWFNHETLAFERSEGIISTREPKLAKENGVHADEPD